MDFQYLPVYRTFVPPVLQIVKHALEKTHPQTASHVYLTLIFKEDNANPPVIQGIQLTSQIKFVEFAQSIVPLVQVLIQTNV
jgi:hypothetical protein